MDSYFKICDNVQALKYHDREGTIIGFNNDGNPTIRFISGLNKGNNMFQFDGC